MKLLVIGSGGREHALAWKLASSPRVQKVYVAPGNGGTATETGVENVPLSGMPELIDFCRREHIHLTVVGPEAPLAEGVVDAFRDGLDALAQAGAKAVIQPGGSVRDDEVIAAADEHGIAMVFTGVRHFRH